MTFASPSYFLLLLLAIPYVLWYFLFRRRHEGTLTLASTEVFRKAPSSWRTRLIHLPFFLRLCCFAAVVTVLARPQTSTSWQKGETEGIHIMMALDISTSMMTPDIVPNRISAAKDVAVEFVANRRNDNIGLTLFGGEAFTQCPLTTDHGMLLRTFKDVSCDLQAQGIIQPGTAIGMGIASAVAHLEKAPGKSKVVILLTDGSNNMGDISPMTAAEIAQSLGIRVYTIGVGTNKVAPYPMPVAGGVQYVNMPVEIDTKTLGEIAQTTHGDFYRATNTQELKKIYKEIDQLEKSKMSVKKFKKKYDAFQPFVMVAAIALLLEILLRITIFRRIP